MWCCMNVMRENGEAAGLSLRHSRRPADEPLHPRSNHEQRMSAPARADVRCA